MPQTLSVFRSPAAEAAYMAAYEACLAEWPLPYEALDTKTSFGRTHIVACGPKEAPPLVLLHGFYGTPITWTANVTELSRRHRVYCVNVLGDVGKSAPTRVPTTKEEGALWLTELFDELKIDKARVAGQSYGGFLTANLAIYAPDRVEKIVLLAPAALVPLSLGFWLRAVPAGLLRTRSILESFVRWHYTDDSPRNASIDRHLALSIEHGKPAIKLAPGVLTDDDLRRIRAPALLLVGQYERAFDGHAAVARVKRVAPSIETQIVPNAAHGIAFERADLVNAAMLRFLG